MSDLIVQGSSTLYKVATSTGTATALTLPTGVTLSTTRKPRFAVLNQWIVVVNSPTQSLAIDPEGTVRLLTPRPPAHAPTAAAGASTGLTGAYKYRTSFIVQNSDGELLMESPLSPESLSFTAANQDISLTDVPVSLDTISARRIYRTLSGGSDAYFHIADLDGNTSTTLLDANADSTVTLLPSMPGTLVSPPGTLPGIRFKIIVEWKSRLWAVADDPTLGDVVFCSETNKVYDWPNQFVAYPTGMDSQGIIAFAKRRNQLGLLKRDGLWQIGGSSGKTGISADNVSISQIAFDKAGCISPDTVVTVNDKSYWLGQDGVYQWDDNGVTNITNSSVAPWFQTDTYFNRSRFDNAFAKYNEIRDQYELHLANAGDSTENRWVALSLKTGGWYGPHLTSAFTPTHAAAAKDDDGLPLTLIGASDGVIYKANQSTFKDGSNTAISFDVTGPWHGGDAPDIQHCWLELSMLSQVEAAGTLTVTPTVGRLNSSAGSAISHTLTTGRERLRRLGDGALMRLRFTHATVSQGVSIYGYECPFFERGRR